MSKGWRNNLILLLALLAVWGGLWWLAVGEEKEKQATEAAKNLSPIPVAEVTAIQFTGTDGVPVHITREGEAWQIREPHPYRTRQQGVEQLVTILAGYHDRVVNPTPGDLAPYGLDAPIATLTVAAEPERQHTLRVGGTSPVGDRRYLQVGENGPVVVVPDYRTAALRVGVERLRDQRLAPDLTAEAITAIHVMQAGEALHLARAPGAADTPAGDWNLTSPIRDRASAERVQGWLQALINASGNGFPTGPAPQDAPTWEVTFSHGAEPLVTLPIWQRGETLLTQRPGQPDLLQLPAHLADELNKGAEELTDRMPLAAGAGPQQLVVHYQGHTLTAHRQDDGQWPLPAWDGVLEGVTREAWQARLPAPGPHPEPLFTITVTRTGDEEPLTLPFWQESDTLVTAPPGRPVELLLSPLQSQTVRESLTALTSPREARGEESIPAVAPAAAPPGGDADATP